MILLWDLQDFSLDLAGETFFIYLKGMVVMKTMILMVFHMKVTTVGVVVRVILTKTLDLVLAHQFLDLEMPQHHMSLNGNM